MKLVVFGLTVSSSWGNGHATLWRGLCRALHERGHHVVFFERDLPYYAGHRDLVAQPGLELILYEHWEHASALAAREVCDADAAIVTSFCPDGPEAAEVVLASAARVRCFYDLDTPVTLDALERQRRVPYLPERGLSDFDLVLSYTGGRALDRLRIDLNARRAVPLYGWVDPSVHRPSTARPELEADLSYLGTYAEDRQAALEALFLRAADALPERWFAMAGAQYPDRFPWRQNLRFVRHLPPGDHAAFFASSRATLNVTRRAMAASGYCPSPRIFEAAACGTPIISDVWEGLDQFFKLGSEVLPARDTADVVAALRLPDEELAAIGQRARARVLAEHTAWHRAVELERLLCGSQGAREREPVTTHEEHDACSA
jgi:spore maturation protein CgeB